MPTRTYLEMTSAGNLDRARVDDPALRLDTLARAHIALYRRLYADVGRAYQWTDRIAWTDEQIAAHLSDPAISVHVLYDGAEPAGYFELRREVDGAIEIAYFGLVPAAIGRGLGKHLLTLAVERAWQERPSRVWLHTSSLDHPHALPNYVKRGFRVVRTESYEM